MERRWKREEVVEEWRMSGVVELEWRSGKDWRREEGVDEWREGGG